MIAATQIKRGMTIKLNGELYRVFSFLHITPGNWRGMVQTKLKSVKSGSIVEHRFRSEDRVEQAFLETHEMEYLYSDGSDYYFMNTETFEQIHLPRELLEDAVPYLIPNIKIQVEFYEGRPTAGFRGAEGGVDGARPSGSDSQQREQARDSGNRPGDPGAAVRQRRRDDSSRHRGRQVP